MFFINVDYDFMNEKNIHRAAGGTPDANERFRSFQPKAFGMHRPLEMP
jgi:hypothetical protein